MKRLFLTLAVALVMSQAVALYGQGKEIKIDLDFASFAYDGETTLLESYLAFGAASLDFQQDSAGFVSLLPVYLALRHATVTTLLETAPPPVWADSAALSFSVPDTSVLGPGQHFLHLVRAIVPPGEYQMMLTIPGNEEVGRRRLVLTRDVNVPDFSSASGPQLSNIEMAASIKASSNRDDLFYRNGLLVRPNPNLLYGSGLTSLYYYLEAYNIDQAVQDSAYSVYTFISQSSIAQPVSGLQRRSQREVRSPDVLVGSFDIGALTSGSYLLNVVLLAADNRAIVEQTRKFFVYNPAVQAQQSNQNVDVAYEASIYAAMTEEEVEEQIRYAKVIATDSERSEMDHAKGLDNEKRVLQHFWEKRDPNPATPLNEFREEYFSRIQYARDRYSSGHAEGWETDRGRTYLKYGMPEHVSPHHYERGSAPYEIWEYDNIPGEGKSMFVFADVGGFNEFELIHSDVAGEPKSLDWRAEVKDQHQ
ncbi:MAG: GWxTD domain-containing protein [Rhodothermales bacterium]